jgi:hypothetical protein
LEETQGVENWTDTLVTPMAKILSDVENQEKVTGIIGSKMNYFVRKSDYFNLLSA